MKMVRSSIKRRIMAAIMLISLTVVLLTSGALFAYEYFTFRHQIHDSMKLLARMTAINLSAPVAFLHEEEAKEAVETLEQEKHVVAAGVYKISGEQYADYRRDDSEDEVIPDRVPKVDSYFVPNGIIIVEPIIHQGARVGTIYLKSDLQALQDRFRLYGMLFGMILAGAMVLAFGLSTVMQRRITRPILALARTARIVSEKKDYGVRAEKLSEDELGLLTEAFNHMLNQIEERESALRESGERLRMALRASQTGTWRWDVAEDKLSWDEFTSGLFGFPPETSPAHLDEFFNLIHPEDREVVRQATFRALEQGEEYYCVFRVARAEGLPRFLASRGRGYSDESGKVTRLTGVCMDITERKKAEDALYESQQRMRSVVDYVADGILTMDEKGVAQSFNQAAEKIFGYRAGEVVGKDIKMLLPEGYGRPEDQDLPGLLRTGERRMIGARREMEGLRKDGGVFPMEIAVSEFQFKGTRYFTAIIRDITERKKVEEEIRTLNTQLEQRVQQRTAELETINRELEAFTYSVSHDLRAPLRHIDGYAQILEQDFLESLGPGAQMLLKRIRKGTVQMGRLVDDLLNLARLGRSDLNLQEVNLNQLIEDVISSLQPETGGRQIEWKVEPLPRILADPGLIQQVFANLLGNAVKYTRPRETALIEIGLVRQEERAALFVRDNGVGFNMAHAGKLFGVFQRLHRVEEFEGTGVGLATVERIIHKHGGNIWAEAEAEKGATFYFTLPGLRGETASP
jgi:PAS domain S-box-containing protein